MISPRSVPLDQDPGRAPFLVRHIWSQRDAGIALVVSLVFAGLYLAMLQARMYGDGPLMVGLVSESTNMGGFHMGYRLGRELLLLLAPGMRPVDQALYCSAVSAGLACGTVFLLARGLGFGRSVALLSVALAASTPVVIFYGTTVELHATQLFLVALGACVTLLAPWGRPLVAISVSAFGLLLAFLGHETSIFMGPGWVLLCAWVAARQGAGFSRMRGLLFVGPGLLGLLVGYLLLLYFFVGGGAREAATSSFDILGIWLGAYSVGTFVWEGVVFPLLLVIPLFVLGMGRGKLDPLLRVAIGVVVLVPLVFFVYFRVPERGGYMLGLLPFVAPVAAVGLHSLALRSRTLVAALAVGLGAGAGIWAKCDYDSMLDPNVHRQLVSDVTEGTGLILNAAVFVAPLGFDFPELEELYLGELISESVKNGVTVEDFASTATSIIEGFVAKDPGLLERGLYLGSVLESNGDTPGVIRGRRYFLALQASLEAKFQLEQRDSSEWRIGTLTRK